MQPYCSSLTLSNRATSNACTLQGVDLKGVPPLAPCRISLNQQLPAALAAAVRDKEQQLPSKEQMTHRDPTGAYSAAAPFWATVSDAKYVCRVTAGVLPEQASCTCYIIFFGAVLPVCCRL